MKKLCAVVSAISFALISFSHDIWIEPSASIVRSGDFVRLSLMLGNHGNEHRDFRLASKVSAGDQNLIVFGPSNKKYDLTSSLVDNGYEPKEGFWSAKFTPTDPGVYVAASTFDKVMSYAPVRDIKSAKTFFLVSKTLDAVAADTTGFDRVLGHALELVPIVNPIAPLGPGTKLKFRLLFRGKPLPNSKVSFIPKGTELKAEIDINYERNTDDKGEVEFEFREPNQYLIAAHHKDMDSKGAGYESINYSATAHIWVPAICPCCGG